MNRENTRPAALLSTLLIFLCASVLTFPDKFTLIFIIGACLFSAAAAILFICEKRLSAVLCVIVFLLGTIIPYASYVKYERSAKDFLASCGITEHTFTAVVKSCMVSGNYSSFQLELKEIDGQKLEQSFSASADTFSGDFAQNGDLLTFSGKPVGLSEVSDKEFDTQGYLKSKRIFIYIPSISVLESSVGDSLSFFGKIRLYIHDVIYSYLPEKYDYTTSAIACALTYGDRSGISRALRNSFTRSGLTHLLCISGMHISVILGFLALFLDKASLHKRTKYVILSFFCVFYIILTGCTMSVLRAGIMALVSYIAMLSGRKYDQISALFVSAVIIITFNPYAFFDISARLSFLSTLGIICFSSYADALDKMNIFRHLKLLLKVLVINAGAVIFTIPISAFSFGGISLASFISTLFISIPVELSLILLIILIALSPIKLYVPICVSVGKLCSLLLKFVVFAARSFSSLRYAYIPCEKNVVTVICFLILVILLCAFISAGKSVLARRIKLSITFLCAFICVTSLVLCVADENKCRIFYYRKNASDRQLSIKSGTDGVLLINADNVLCTNPDKAFFDTFSGKNSLLIIPDEGIDAAILSHNIVSFENRFGLENIYVPETSDGTLLANKLFLYGIDCRYFPEYLISGDNIITASVGENTKILVKGENTDALTVFADSYSRDLFDEYHTVCAFFTRDTKGQFDAVSDAIPDCKIFYTRMKKDSERQNTQNAYGKSSFEIKE